MAYRVKEESSLGKEDILRGILYENRRIRK